MTFSIELYRALVLIQIKFDLNFTVESINLKIFVIQNKTMSLQIKTTYRYTCNIIYLQRYLSTPGIYPSFV